MRATEELEKSHREAPLGPAGDRVAAVFAGLVPLADPGLEAMRLSGALVVGEVNNSSPNARTLHLPDGSHAIVIHSGLIDFYESVSKILFGASNVDHDGKITKAASSIDDVVANLKTLFEAWTPEGISQDRMARIAQTPLPSDPAEMAAMLVKTALTFVLSHEFGHVQYYKPPRGKKPAVKLTTQQETEADAAGARNLLFAAAAEGRGPARMSIAGAVVSLRVLAVLADLGHTFAEGHPPPVERLKTVIAAARGICSTEREFWSLSTIAYASDEQLAVAGAKATGTDLPFTFEHACSRLVSILETIAKGRKPVSELLLGMRPDFEKLPEDSLMLLAGFAALLFPAAPAKTDDASQDQLWAAMSTLLRNAIPSFPEPARTAFQIAFSHSALHGR